MTAVAALESGQAPSRPIGPNALVVAAYVAGSGLILVTLGLLAGFYNLRQFANTWPPNEVEIDEYLSVMLTTTLLLSGAVVAWAANAATLGNRRQALAGLAMTGGLGLAFLNLAWYTGIHAGFGPASHSFGVIVIAALAVGAASVAAGIGFLAVALLRAVLRADGAGTGMVGAATRFWYLVIVAWMVSPVALYGLMSVK